MEMIGIDTNLLQTKLFSLHSGTSRTMDDVVNEWMLDQHKTQTHITVVDQKMVVTEEFLIVLVWYISHG